MTRAEILDWLRQTEPASLAELYRAADETRKRHVGDAVHLRGLVEISNHCARKCEYCGLRAPNRALERYRMGADEILACAKQALGLGYGTVVLQAGEDFALTGEWVAAVVRRIKTDTGLAVTLSLGERSEAELAAWRQAGADRYLLRFETSDAGLFRAIHPPLAGRRCDRIELLRELRRIGYEIGSGVMTGIPGQTLDSLADDIVLFRELDLDMIGVGPFLPHAATPLGEAAAGEEELVYKVMALARLVRPDANIPSTSALATINPRNGRELGLQRGGNVMMPNLTPMQYRALYEIYPAKACIRETASQCNGCMRGRIRSLGREAGSGAGGRGWFEREREYAHH